MEKDVKRGVQILSWFNIIKNPVHLGPFEDLKRLLPYQLVSDLYDVLKEDYTMEVIQNSNRRKMGEEDYEEIDKLFDEGTVDISFDITVGHFPYVAIIDTDRYHSEIKLTLEMPEYTNSYMTNITLIQPLWDYFKLRDVFEIINNNFKLGNIELKAVLGNKRNRNKHLNTWPEIQKELYFIIDSVKRTEKYYGKPHDYKTAEGRKELKSALWYNTNRDMNITTNDNFIYFLATFWNELGLS